MSGETDLGKLLQGMQPQLHKGEFVYCTVESMQSAHALEPFCIFREDEAVTVILPRQKAEEAPLPCSAPLAWITLTVHSSLEAVGLTAAVSRALTEANISCNVVAAYHHDHLFVPVQDAKRAMDVLASLSKQGGV